MATRVLMEQNSVWTIFKEDLQETFLQSLVHQIGPVVREQMFKETADDARRTQSDRKSSRWAPCI